MVLQRGRVNYHLRPAGVSRPASATLVSPCAVGGIPPAKVLTCALPESTLQGKVVVIPR